MFHVKQKKKFDVIVVGAGHAGVEAALAASKMCAKTALVTFSMEDLGTLSCNPAIGGLGKGHLVREIDSLGGMMGFFADQSGIQFRMLNKTRGEAVQGPRAQIDRRLYKRIVRQTILDNKGIEVFENEVIDIKTENANGISNVCGLELEDNRILSGKKIILTTGTFLGGKIFLGKESWSAGRLNSPASKKLSNFFKKNNFYIKRLKTGTPPRLKAKTINFEACIVQNGDSPPIPFSFLTTKIVNEQTKCYITKTNIKTHDLIKDNIGLSPIYNGKIDSKGPRYCPSIEDKVIRFNEKTNHLIFLEPEEYSGNIIYPNGISTSLPKRIQHKFIKTIKGLENAEIEKFGYAIEYYSLDGSEILKTYETKKIKGLYLSGQINGTTGYEEAAAQGLLAGINAALSIQNKKPFILKRSEAYLGVLTDDLTIGGLNEPYRMFTSRAEYRIMLRADNADSRLTDYAINLGLTCRDREKMWQEKKDLLKKTTDELKQIKASPQQIKKNGVKINLDGKKRSAYEVLGYNQSSWKNIQKIWPQLDKINISDTVKNQIRVNAFYSKYVHRQNLEIESIKNDFDLKFKNNLDFNQCAGISNEIKEMLKKRKPKNFGEARKLPGMTPAAAALLLRHLKKAG